MDRKNRGGSIKTTLVLLAFFSMIYGKATAEGSDSTEVNNLCGQFVKTLDVSPDKALLFAQKAFDMSSRIGYSKGIAISQYNLGMYFIKAGKDLEAIGHLRASLPFLLKLNLKKRAGTALSLMGKGYLNMGILDSSLTCYRNSLPFLDDDGDPSGQTILYNSLGNIYEARNDLDSALHYYQKAESIMSHLQKNDDKIGYTYRGIGNIYYRKHNLKLALQYYNAALEGYQKSGYTNEMATTYTNLGNVWSDSGKYDMALTDYNKALELKRHLNDKRGIAEALINIGVLFNDKADTTNFKNGSKDWDTAIKYYFQALPVAEEIGGRPLVLQVYLNLSSTYANLKKFDSAFTYFTKYDNLKDSLVNEQSRKAMADMLVKYQDKEKEHRIALTIAEARTRTVQLYYASGAFILILFLVAIIFLFYRQRVRTRELIAAKNEQIQNQKIDELLKVQEIKSFQSMIEGQEQERKRIAEDLHDGLGILLSTVKLHFSSIEDRLDKQANAQEPLVKGLGLLDEALNEVRRIAHSMSAGVLTNIGLAPALEDLKETIEAGGKMKVNLFIHNMEARLETITEIYIYRMIQELISNILKYAEATEISLTVNKDLNSNILTIIVEDDGIGFDKTEKMNGKGTGLKNIAARAERLNGSFNIDSNKGKGTTAIIEIPV